MKKTITINIAGLVFNIEEDAYSSLKNYLESIGNKFNNLGERQEIIEDIEARIAELFSEKLNRNKEVISQLDVDNIIGVMGSPDNFEEEESSYSETDTEPKPTSKNEKKKFFRDPDNKVVGGVCAGVSNYFGWDISIVRLIFAFSVLLLGTGFWLYILLWIIIPEAKSTSEKLAMEGKNATVNNIKGFFTKFKNDIESIDTANVNKNIKNHSNKFNQFLVGTSQKFNETFRPKENVTSFFSSIFSFIGFILISIGIVMILTLIYSLFFHADNTLISGIIDDINRQTNLHSSHPIILWTIVLFFITSIAISLVTLGIRFSFNKNKELTSSVKKVGKISRFLVIFSIICLVAFNIFNISSNDPRLFSSSRLRTYELDYKTIVIKKMEQKNEYNELKEINFDIEKSSTKIPYLHVAKYASGFKSGKINSKNVFNIKIKDSIVKICPNINYDKHFFANPNIEVTLYLPDNDSTVLINEFDD